MPTQLGLALATLAAGAGLLAAAMLGTAAAAPPASGVLKVGTTGNLDSIDPAIAYGTTSWWLESATGAWLYAHPDSGASALVPQVAKRFTVSKNGRVYRFYLRRGYRFSDGERVTAASFAYAIRRAKNNPASPAGPFVSDRKKLDIVKVHAKGLALTITLLKPAPQLLAVLAMPFFQAASSKLPLQKEVIDVRGVGELPTAGPYTWSFDDPNHQADIVRNPYYHGPRPGHVAGVELDMRLRTDDCYQRTVDGDLDLGCVPPDQVQNVAATYGVSRTKPVKTGRFWVKAGDCLSFLPLNKSRALFHENPSLRKALNWAFDRTAFAFGGPYLGTAWTHLLPVRIPGSISARRLQPYSVRGDMTKARQLASGHLGDGRIRIAYQSAGSAGPRSAQVVKQTLIDLGFEESRIEMKGYAGFNLYEAIGTRGAPFDLAVGIGFCADSDDPADMLAAFLDNGDWSADSAFYRKALASISTRLKGQARLRALGRFDLEIMRKLAPVVPLYMSSDRSFFSARVDPGSLAYTRYGWSIPALRLK